MFAVLEIINGIGKSDKDQFFPYNQKQEPEEILRNYSKKQFRLDLRKIFFSQRVVGEWNSLSKEIVTSETVNQFRVRLNKFNKFWKEKSTKFEPDCYSYPFAHARHNQFHERR